MPPADRRRDQPVFAEDARRPLRGAIADIIRAAYLGHAVEVNRAVYLHASPADLAVARDALAAVYGIDGK